MNDVKEKDNVKAIKTKKIIVVFIILAIILIYVGYSLYKLISHPTNIFMVENR